MHPNAILSDKTQQLLVKFFYQFCLDPTTKQIPEACSQLFEAFMRETALEGFSLQVMGLQNSAGKLTEEEQAAFLKTFTDNFLPYAEEVARVAHTTESFDQNNEDSESSELAELFNKIKMEDAASVQFHMERLAEKEAELGQKVQGAREELLLRAKISDMHLKVSQEQWQEAQKVASELLVWITDELAAFEHLKKQTEAPSDHQSLPEYLALRYAKQVDFTSLLARIEEFIKQHGELNNALNNSPVVDQLLKISEEIQEVKKEIHHINENDILKKYEKEWSLIRDQIKLYKQQDSAISQQRHALASLVEMSKKLATQSKNLKAEYEQEKAFWEEDSLRSQASFTEQAGNDALEAIRFLYPDSKNLPDISNDEKSQSSDSPKITEEFSEQQCQPRENKPSKNEIEENSFQGSSLFDELQSAEDGATQQEATKAPATTVKDLVFSGWSSITPDASEKSQGPGTQKTITPAQFQQQYQQELAKLLPWYKKFIRWCLEKAPFVTSKNKAVKILIEELQKSANSDKAETLDSVVNKFLTDKNSVGVKIPQHRCEFWQKNIRPNTQVAIDNVISANTGVTLAN